MKKKPTNKDYGRRPYVSDDDYQTSMRRVPDKAVYNEQAMKQSEFKKPYRSDSETYQEMEYHYGDPSIPDYLSPQPNTDVTDVEIPGATLWSIETLLCNWELCYCKGQTVCFDYWCTFPIVKAWFDDPGMGVSFSGNQICISASPDMIGGQWLNYTLKLFHTGLVAGKRVTKTSYSNQFTHVWECLASQCCGCTGISIGYTTQQMSVNGTQTLTVVGATEGCTYNWAIASGGGSLSSGTGTSVVYTAPATNAECANNPTITLSAGGAQCDVLEIAVNAVSGRAYDLWYYAVCADLASGHGCDFLGDYYGCNGVDWGNLSKTIIMACTTTYPNYSSECDDYLFSIEGVRVGQPKDTRTATQKTAGCCPAALL